MKKAFIISAICALVLCSCSKSSDEESNNSFGRAEIHFELAGPDYQGVPSDDVLEYFSFTVTGKDFEGNTVSKEIDANNPEAAIVCKKAPTADKSLFADLGLDVIEKKTVQDGDYSMQYSLHVHYVIYDKNDNEISTGFVTRTSCSHTPASAQEFKRELSGNSFNGTFELCYVKMFFSEEWNYNIAYKKGHQD